MRDIVEVGLKNYQSHKDTVVTFESGLNVIIGATDSGKTSIKRGIEAVLYNRYVGAEEIRHGETSFSNYIIFNDGLKITREKGGRGINKYIIDYPNGESLELNNFGTKVPQEVLDAHGMYLVELGKEIDSLNCANQLSGPFFLQNTAGERASIIGSIAKTQVIDEAISDTLSSHREHRKTLKSLEVTNKSLDVHINSYNEWIDDAKELLSSIESDYERLRKLNEKHETLNNSFNSIESNTVKAAIQRNIIDSFDDIAILDEKVLELINRFNEVNRMQAKFDKVTSDEHRKEYLLNTINQYKGIDNECTQVDEIIDIIQKYDSISKKVNLLSSTMKQVDKLARVISTFKDIDTVISDIDSLSKDVAKFNELSKKVGVLTSLSAREQKGKEVVKNLNKSLLASVEKYQKMIEALGKCPTCYSIITDEQLSNIKNNLA